MPDRKKIIKGLEKLREYADSVVHPILSPDNWNIYSELRDLIDEAKEDAIAMLKEQQEERKRMLSWLSKFCRHIDNGDNWLMDEENLNFFREKMKQQFGWFAD